jgi:membrane dipeptidase
MLRKLLLTGLALLLIAALCIRFFAPGFIETRVNTVAEHDPYPISSAALDLHQTLTVLDWHSDTMLWQRDFLQRAKRGHVDLPRMQAGNMAVAVFTAATRAPMGQNVASNSAETGDMFTPMVIVQGWPVASWNSLLQRALYQAQRLQGYVEAAPEQLRWINSATDLERLLKDRNETQRADRQAPIGVLMGTEGSHALEGDLNNVDVLFEAGFRMMSLQHFFDNRLGGSLHGESKAGLSSFGREVVQRIQQREIILDLAHSSTAVVQDVLAMSSRPVVVSHTGVFGKCATARNFPDALMRDIAASGGLIAIGFWDKAVCDITPAGVAAAISYAVGLVGEDHVALGSDFDGGTRTSFDSSELVVLTQALLDAGMSETAIAKVMGGNSVEFLLRWLPRG